MIRVRYSLSHALSCLLLCSCNKMGMAVANDQNLSHHPTDKAIEAPSRQLSDVRIVFYNFRNRATVLTINGDVFYEGVLDVPKKRASNGIALILPAKLGGNTNFHLKSEELDFNTTIDITPQIKVIYISPRRPPYIKATSDSAVYLD